MSTKKIIGRHIECGGNGVQIGVHEDLRVRVGRQRRLWTLFNYDSQQPHRPHHSWTYSSSRRVAVRVRVLDLDRRLDLCPGRHVRARWPALRGRGRGWSEGCRGRLLGCTGQGWSDRERSSSESLQEWGASSAGTDTHILTPSRAIGETHAGNRRQEPPRQHGGRRPRWGRTRDRRSSLPGGLDTARSQGAS